MDERQRIVSARRLRDIRACEQRASRFASIVASSGADEAAGALKAKHDAQDALYARWTALLDRGGIDADAVRRLKHEAHATQEDLACAEQAAAEAYARRDAAADDNGQALLRLAQVAKVLRDLKRRLTRKRDETSLRDVEDLFAAARRKQP